MHSLRSLLAPLDVGNIDSLRIDDDCIVQSSANACSG